MLSDPACHLHVGSALVGRGQWGVHTALTGRQGFTLHFAGLLPLSRCQGPGKKQAVPTPGTPLPWGSPHLEHPSPGAPLTWDTPHLITTSPKTPLHSLGAPLTWSSPHLVAWAQRSLPSPGSWGSPVLEHEGVRTKGTVP